MDDDEIAVDCPRDHIARICSTCKNDSEQEKKDNAQASSLHKPAFSLYPGDTTSMARARSVAKLRWWLVCNGRATTEEGKTAADYLVGRVCYVGHSPA